MSRFRKTFEVEVKKVRKSNEERKLVIKNICILRSMHIPSSFIVIRRRRLNKMMIEKKVISWLLDLLSGLDWSGQKVTVTKCVHFI